MDFFLHGHAVMVGISRSVWPVFTLFVTGCAMPALHINIMPDSLQTRERSLDSSLSRNSKDGYEDAARMGMPPRPAPQLPTGLRGGSFGMQVTKWLGLEWSTDYRPLVWALGFTGFRLSPLHESLGKKSDWARLDFEGGAGAGLGGGVCLMDSTVCTVEDGAGEQEWYEGFAYGLYVGAGGSIHVSRFLLFLRARFRSSQAGSMPMAHRFLTSIGGEVTLFRGLQAYVAGGYLLDWTDEGESIAGPAFEIGFKIPISLLSSLKFK